jgi:hypothetical protein
MFIYFEIKLEMTINNNGIYEEIEKERERERERTKTIEAIYETF